MCVAFMIRTLLITHLKKISKFLTLLLVQRMTEAASFTIGHSKTISYETILPLPITYTANMYPMYFLHFLGVSHFPL